MGFPPKVFFFQMPKNKVFLKFRKEKKSLF